MITKFFKYLYEVEQDRDDPSSVIFIRSLMLLVKLGELPADFAEIFPGELDEVVLDIEDEVDFDDLVDKFENFAASEGGVLEENETTGII